jgi:hypothetical protein
MTLLSLDLPGRGHFTVDNFERIGKLGHLLKIKTQ